MAIQPAEPRHPVPPAPIHPLAALVTIVLDNVFGWIDVIPGAILMTSLGVGGLGFLSTTLIQRYLAREEWGVALAKGVAMGIVAGVPFQVTGTAIGAVLLGWAGANKWIKLPPLRTGTATLPDKESGQEIVDVEPK